MNFGFQQDTLDVRTGDGLDDELLENLDYIDQDGNLLRAPSGSRINGFSVPQSVQNIIPPTGGDWFSSVMHDNGYGNTLLIIPASIIATLNEIPDSSTLFAVANYSQKQCDDLILECMTVQDAKNNPKPSGKLAVITWTMANARRATTRQVIYRALRMFGHIAYANDRNKP